MSLRPTHECSHKPMSVTLKRQMWSLEFFFFAVCVCVSLFLCTFSYMCRCLCAYAPVSMTFYLPVYISVSVCMSTCPLILFNLQLALFRSFPICFETTSLGVLFLAYRCVHTLIYSFYFYFYHSCKILSYPSIF